MASSLPPISKEQAFLETYFQRLSKFAYDKAKELSDKEKEILKTQPGPTTWGNVVIALGHLANAEKGYTSLLFLGPNMSLGQKIFSKKDNVKTSYGTLLSDLRKIEDLASRHEPTKSSEVNLEQLLGHLCGQLSHFCSARLKCMDFYEQMVTLSSNRHLSYKDLLIVIGDIIQSHQKCFHHPILSPIKTSVSLECDIINQLILAQCDLQTCDYLPCLLHLHEAHTKLVLWGGFLVSKEGRKLGFGSSKLPVPSLYQWLDKFKGLLISKFSLYFNEVLSKQAPAQDFKSLLAKAPVDFISKIQTFQKKSDAHSICLVFDVNELEEMYKGLGYHHPQKFTESPRGMDSYPAIYSYPTERPDRHWPSVISILTDKVMELNGFDKNIYFCDEKHGSTYFMAKVEPRIALVVIFEAKKAERDSYVNNFLNEICALLRGTRLFAALKPGVKG